MSTNTSQPGRAHRRPKTKRRNRERTAQPNMLKSSSYHAETRRPIVCLAFVFPMILAYEIGAIFLGHPALRSGVDQWLDRLLANFGFGQVIILPLVTAAILIVFHHRRRDHWQFGKWVLPGMLVESVGLGLILFWAASAYQQMMSIAVPTLDSGAVLTPLAAQTIQWGPLVGALGSGIYEELLFRVILLLPVIYWLNQITKNNRVSTSIGIVLVSLVFAALHYSLLNPAGVQFEISTFLFRFLASVIFCFLFLFRGFGIAVGTHAAYDILAQL